MDLLENQVLENQQQGEVLSVYINQLLEVLFLMEKIFQEKWIKKQTVSSLQPGEMQPERDHDFKGEKTRTGELNGRKFRKAVNGGWFSF